MLGVGVATGILSRYFTAGAKLIWYCASSSVQIILTRGGSPLEIAAALVRAARQVSGIHQR